MSALAQVLALLIGYPALLAFQVLVDRRFGYQLREAMTPKDLS